MHESFVKGEDDDDHSMLPLHERMGLDKDDVVLDRVEIVSYINKENGESSISYVVESERSTNPSIVGMLEEAKHLQLMNWWVNTQDQREEEHGEG